MQRDKVFLSVQKAKRTELHIAEQVREAKRKQADARIDSSAPKWRFPIAGGRLKQP